MEGLGSLILHVKSKIGKRADLTCKSKDPVALGNGLRDSRASQFLLEFKHTENLNGDAVLQFRKT